MNPRRSPGIAHLSIGILSLISLMPASARAQMAINQPVQTDSVQAASLPPITYGADVGLGESDNVTLSSTNKISQTIATTDLDFAVKEQSRLLEVNAKGDFTDLYYVQGAYGNQFIGRFDGLAQYAIIPERLTWVLRDDFGQSTLDAFTPITPNNVQNVNYVSTGPNLYLRIGGTGFVNVGARYAEAYYESSPFNSNRALATLAAGLQLSARSSVSLNGAGERVLFDNTQVNNDFDRYSVYGHYEAHGARTDFAVDLGATTVDQHGTATGITTVDLVGPRALELAVPGRLLVVSPIVVPETTSPQGSTTGPLARLELARALSPAAKLTFTAGRELTDAASSFSTLQGGAIGAINYAPTPLTSDSYTSTYATVGWQYVRNRTTVGLTGRWERDRYPGQAEFDLTTSTAELDIQRQLTRAFNVELMGRIYRTDYTNAVVPPSIGSPKNDTSLIGAAIAWRSGRWLEVRLRYTHDSYTVPAGYSGYQENRVFLTVGYRPFPAQELLPLPQQLGPNGAAGY